MKKQLLDDIRFKILKHIGKHRNDIKLDIARDIDVTFSQIHVILKEEFEPLGLVRPLKKEGRRVYLNLTKRGKDVLKLAIEMKKLMEVTK